MPSAQYQNNVQQPQPAPGPRRRILRIGILLGGKIIEERLIRERSSVTIGQSSKNTFSVAIEALPREWVLFALHADRYSLHFSGAMDGRLSDGGQVYTFDALKHQVARQTGDGWVLPLSDQSRGKVSIGDLTLLFQFVTEPPKQPRPMLPASVRGTFADRIDPQLAVIEAISIVCTFTIALWALYFHDVAVDNSLAQQAYNRTFKQDAYDVQTFDLPEQATDTGTAQETKQPDQPKTPTKPKGDQGKSKKPDDTSGRDTNDAVTLRQQAVSYADGLFADDTSDNGLSGGMDRRKPGTDLGQQLDAVQRSGAKVEVGGGTGRGTRGGGSARTGTGRGPDLHGQEGIHGNDKNVEKVPPGRIKVGQHTGDTDVSLTPDAVLRKIMQAYMAGLKRCHKDLLKTDPTARGKVTLAFTVSESGRVSRANVDGFNDNLDACIKSRVMTWRFPAPKDKDGDPTDADFQITLQLVPE
jgi:hypothetical protein